MPERVIFTVGHGNRTLAELLHLLQCAGTGTLVDVRRFPGSRRHPHFARASLETALPAVGIAYLWAGEHLGGRRRPLPDSPHSAVRNDSFRAYADHMGTPLFQEAVEALRGLAEKQVVTVMCAERLPWRCHRYFLADALLLAGVRVLHLVEAETPREHRLSPYARVADGLLIYDRTPDDQHNQEP